MGLRTALIISSTSFLLGTLCMHWTADHLLLWQSPITHVSLLSALNYYHHTLVQMSQPFNAALHTVGIIGAALLASKALGGRESNWLFDGASLFLFGASGMVYYSKILPSLAVLPPLSPVPRADPTNPSDATFEPLRELAASHAVLAVALVGVILLQSGQYYSETLEERERIEEVEARLRRRQRKARLEQERVASAAASGVASGTTAAGSGSGSNAVPAA